MIHLRIALLALALGNLGVQIAAAAHTLPRDRVVSELRHEVMPRLRRPVADRSQRPVRPHATVEGSIG